MPLSQVADDLPARFEVLRDPALIVALSRRRAHPAAHLGDDAERSLGAEDELSERRAGRGVRRLPRPEPSRWRSQLDRRDDVVESLVATRGLPGRAGGGEP